MFQNFSFQQISPLKYKGSDADLKATFISLNDGTTPKPVKVCLFSKDAENLPKVDDTVEISNVYRYQRKTDGNNNNDPPTSFGTKPASTVDVCQITQCYTIVFLCVDILIMSKSNIFFDCIKPMPKHFYCNFLTTYTNISTEHIYFLLQIIHDSVLKSLDTDVYLSDSDLDEMPDEEANQAGNIELVSCISTQVYPACSNKGEIPKYWYYEYLLIKL